MSSSSNAPSRIPSWSHVNAKPIGRSRVRNAQLNSPRLPLPSRHACTINSEAIGSRFRPKNLAPEERELAPGALDRRLRKQPSSSRTARRREDLRKSDQSRQEIPRPDRCARPWTLCNGSVVTCQCGRPFFQTGQSEKSKNTYAPTRRAGHYVSPPSRLLKSTEYERPSRRVKLLHAAWTV